MLDFLDKVLSVVGGALEIADSILSKDDPE